jgi:N-formylmaleamate deformylase
MMKAEARVSTFNYGAHIHANGIRQHYLRFGAGRDRYDPVILIPGITSPAITWAFVGERLGEIFDTYIIDVRGRGLSQAEDDLDFSLDAQAWDLTRFAEALGISSYNVLGHSMGARIAVRSARQEPKGKKRLALIDPPVSGPGRRPYPTQYDWYSESMRLARLGADADAMRPFFPSWRDDELSLRAEWLPTCSERAVRTSFDGFHTDNVHADMTSIECPVLLVTAERGDVIRDEDVAEISTLMPKFQSRRIMRAGHMIPWDNEEDFHKAITGFFCQDP